MASIEEIAETLSKAFPDQDGEIDPAALDLVMQQFSPLLQATAWQVEKLLSPNDRTKLRYELSSWNEADTVVNGQSPDEKSRRINDLLRDTCTCVLQHLPFTAVRAVKNGNDIHPAIAMLASRAMVLKKDHESLNAAKSKSVEKQLGLGTDYQME